MSLHPRNLPVRTAPIRFGDAVRLAEGPSPEMLVVDAEPGRSWVTVAYKAPGAKTDRDWDLPRDELILVRRARR